MCGLTYKASLNALQMICFVKQNDTKHFNSQNKNKYLTEKDLNVNKNTGLKSGKWPTPVVSLVSPNVD